MSVASLPLICPRCLHNGAELRLEARHCPRCDATYPEVDGVLVALVDERLAKEVVAGASSSDARTSFYQSRDEFLRDTTGGHEALEQYEQQTRGEGLVLEVGSGRGAFSHIGGADYCALDYSLTSLRAFVRHGSRVCASAESVPLATGSCRLVFSIATLEHVPDPSRAFAEIDRVLRPGGMAYLAPAWHCRDWAADGLPVRPYSALTPSQKLRKALIPVRDSVLFRGLVQVPWRAGRRLRARASATPTRLAFTPLRANYEQFWMSDSDACASIDSHEAILFFETRKYELIVPRGSVVNRLLFRSGGVVVRKPTRTIAEPNRH